MSEGRSSEELRGIPAPNGLDAIAAEAAKFDAAIAENPGNSPEIPAPAEPTRAELASSAREWRDAVGFGCGIVLAMRPELAEEWTEPRLNKLGDALAKCGQHYNWNIEKLLGHPVLALVSALWPLGVGLVNVEKARNAKKQAAE